MNIRSLARTVTHAMLAVMLATWTNIGFAQVPVDDSGNPIGEYQAQDLDSGSDDFDNSNLDGDAFIAASPAELEDLVGSIALYPDDLLAIILPASTYPLQLVEAARFLDELETNPSLQPDDDWDDSVVALTNYPEVIELLNDDLDWTWQLGEAVVAQQADVISAIETFRDRAYAAGNLKSDDYQEVTHEEGVIEITPVNEEIIYVPYYEPERVVVYQPQPVYYYHPRPYPVYNYPYPYGHSFSSGYFWGVTTAFTIGWATDYLHVHHHSYYGHPYYSYNYNTNWWYRRPSISVHNTYYVNNYNSRSNNYYQNGDRWQSNNTRRLGSEQQVTRSRYRTSSGSQVARRSTSSSFASPARTSVGATSRSSSSQSSGTRDSNARTSTRRSSSGRDSTRKTAVSDATTKIKFRERDAGTSVSRDRQTGLASSTRTRNAGTNVNSSRRTGNSDGSSRNTTTARKGSDPDVQFKPRNNERNSDSSRGSSSSPSRSTAASRNTTVARNKTVTPSARVSVGSDRRTSSSKNATTARRTASSTPPRSGPSRSQSTRRAEQSSTTQRQSSPTRSKSQPSSSKSGSGSASKKSESASRSNNRSSAGKKSRSRDT